VAHFSVATDPTMGTATRPTGIPGSFVTGWPNSLVGTALQLIERVFAKPAPHIWRHSHVTDVQLVTGLRKLRRIDSPDKPRPWLCLRPHCNRHGARPEHANARNP
jgi:hypothetical protein